MQSRNPWFWQCQVRMLVSFLLYIWPKKWKLYSTARNCLEFPKYSLTTIRDSSEKRRMPYPMKLLANSILAENHLNYLTVSSFWEHSVSSQGTQQMNSYCEPDVSFPWVCNSQLALLPLHGESSDDLMNISPSKLTVWFWSFLFLSVANDKHIQAPSNLT